MGKKNFNCENSDSCSLISVTGISADTSCSESCSSTSSSSKSCKSSNNCSSSESSSITSTTLSSSSNSHSSCSSEQTYSDNTTCKTSCKTSSTCDSTSKSSNDNTHSKTNSNNKCDDVSSSKCEKICYKKCEKLVKKYNCAKEELLAISDIIVVLNFVKSKLLAVQPNIDLRNVSKYAVKQNIDWIECFVDTLFCVLRKNDAYKIIKVKDCKLKNDTSDEVVDNRTYLVKIKYCVKGNEVCKNLPLVFEWTQLTNNDAKSFKGILNAVIRQIDNYIKGYQAASTVPFLC